MGVTASVQLPADSPQADRLAAALHAELPGSSSSSSPKAQQQQRSVRVAVGNAAMMAGASAVVPPAAEAVLRELEVNPHFELLFAPSSVAVAIQIAIKS